MKKRESGLAAIWPMPRSAFFGGTSNLVTKIGVSALPTAVFASMRYLIAGLLLLLVALGAFLSGSEEFRPAGRRAAGGGNLF
jgi:hypothetical protein